MISERNLGFESDNLLNYSAGPIKISVNSEHIILSTSPNWDFLLRECFELAKEAWLFEDSDVSHSELEIKIKYDLSVIKLYVEYSIIFL